MGKRKSESSESKIQRKIRKLQEKLSSKCKRRVIYSEDEDDSNSQFEGSPAPQEQEDSGLSSSTGLVDAVVHSPPPPPPPSSPTQHVVMDEIATAEQIEVEEVELDGDILKLLGDAPKEDTPLGQPIHKDVASRWQEILSKGLPKEIKDQMLSEYLVPRNCDFLLAPSLNLEAKAAMTESLVKRDTFLMHKQKQLGIAISALASATSLILSDETSKQKLLKPISDACRILCDNHYVETKSRRNLVISSTNTQLKDTLNESSRDKSWLFGENISEKLKAAKTIQKSGDELKNQPKINPRANFFHKNIKGRLNFKSQHRKVDNKPSTSNDSGRGRQQFRTLASRTTSSHRTPRRSPPPRRTAHK